MDTTHTSSFITDMAGLRDIAGRHVGYTNWAVMTQEQVNQFADVTGDRNFIHVDPERAAATPFRGTIAHGFLTLSLLAPVTQQLQVSDAGTSINYGLDKVRFPAPLPVGAEWRGGAEVLEATEINGGMQLKMLATVEIKDSGRPAVAAECLIRFYA